MKTFCVGFALLMVCSNFSFGKIKNGYALHVEHARESLKALQTLLDETALVTNAQRKLAEARIKTLVNYISYFELTENLLQQFRLVAPDLYNEIDSIKDRQRRPTDVFVKFIPPEEANVQAWGITNINFVPEDRDMYKSEYGDGTVSVKIWIVTKALLVLAHEFGHIKYQVPNLANYREYYANTYRPGFVEPNWIGHDKADDSGRSADLYAKKFLREYSDCLKNGSVRAQSPIALREVIRKRVYELLVKNRILATSQLQQTEVKGLDRI
ncbi:MAG TPA: hypothetical protein VK589_24985 [Chryseolinea sp.]|nr:hypothetical protein [Chryseolinea sp.]